MPSFTMIRLTYLMPLGDNYVVELHHLRGPGIRGTQVKSSGNKNRMSPSRSSDGAYFSETPPSWHVRPIFSLIVIL